MDNSKLDSLLSENQRLLREIIFEQNTLPYSPDMARFKKLHNNILSLTNIADNQPDTPNLLFQHYIPLSTYDIQKINTLERIHEAIAGEYFQRIMQATKKRERSEEPPKKSRAECKWRSEEEDKFLEGLEKFGEKNLDAIAQHIGTRTKVQVRSHLQKYKLKMSRLVRK